MRKEITRKLSEALEDHINARDPRIYWSKEVTFDYSSMAPVRVDYMRFKPINNTVSGIEKGDFYCYEIKSSVEDFHSKNGHNHLGDYNYYVMPATVYGKVSNEIPYAIGVLVADSLDSDCVDLRPAKKARRQDRTRPALEMLLMMFRSNARDRHREVTE